MSRSQLHSRFVIVFLSLSPFVAALAQGCAPAAPAAPAAAPVAPAHSEQAPLVVASVSASAPAPETTAEELEKAIALVERTCRWSHDGYASRFAGDCKGLATWGTKPPLDRETRRALLASPDPHRRFLGIGTSAEMGMSFDEVLTTIEREPERAVVHGLLRVISRERQAATAALAPRLAALAFDPKVGELDQPMLFEIAVSSAQTSDGKLREDFFPLRDRALAEGAQRVRQRALETLRCEEVAKWIDDADDEKAASAVTVVLGRTGSPDCDPKLTTRAIAETKKRGAVRMRRVESYLGVASVRCRMSDGIPGGTELGIAHATLADWFGKQRLAPAGKAGAPQTQLGKELAEVNVEARKQALEDTAQACWHTRSDRNAPPPRRGR